MGVGWCHKAALPIDRAVPRPSRSRCDARLSGNRTFGVSPSVPPGDKGHIDILQLPSHNCHFRYFGFVLAWMRSDLRLPRAVRRAFLAGRAPGTCCVRAHTGGCLEGCVVGLGFISVSSSEGFHPPLLFSIRPFLSKRCLIPTVHVFPDCWEGVCWDQSTG